MTAFDHKKFGQEMAATVRDFVERQVQPLELRIAELEARLAEVETRSMRYAGVHQRAQSYRRGDAVTCHGGLWIAVRDVAEAEEPGSSSGWQLAAKGGPR